MEIHNKQIIDNWIKMVSSNDIVIVIGAGFSRNAWLDTIDLPADKKIPLWDDLIETVRNKIGLPMFDSLLAFDIYREHFGKKDYEKLLLESMPDDNLIPSNAHSVLSKMPKIKAIITTNNIDTLLDKTYKNSHKIIKDTDVVGISDEQLSIIYLHGHRNYPESWVFSRNDYDELNCKFPLKTALCKTLLATHPSLFIGFGYSDQDLHSIMKYVNFTVDKYKPAMLSISVSEKNNTLIEYWKKLGLNISISRDETGDKSIEEELVDTLQYINKKRIENLIIDGKISPGYRDEKSFMETLVEQKFECKQRNKTIVRCDYHDSRARSEIYRLSSNCDIVSISAYTAVIKPKSQTAKLIQDMQNGYIPAGSWGLMPSHREWLTDGIKKHLTKSNTINLLIAGVAGLAHFVDTMSLVLKATRYKIHISVTIIDVCLGPIEDIKKFLKKRCLKNSGNNFNIYEEVFNAVRDKKVSITYINDDILKNNLAENYFDIVLSHHLVSDLGADNIIIIEKYAEKMFKVLKNKGIVISAQNIKPNEMKIISFQKLMQDKGLTPIDTKSVFDVYDYNNKMITERDLGLFVEKETLLTIHKKDI